VNVSAEEGERPQIDVFTFNASELTLPSGKTVPANGDKITWDFDSDIHVVGSPVLVDDDATRYDQVIARGHPLGACFTIGDSRSHSVVADWDPSLQAIYITAGTDTSAYQSLSGPTADYDRQDEMEEARRDPKLHKVFKYFRWPTRSPARSTAPSSAPIRTSPTCRPPLVPRPEIPRQAAAAHRARL
jgi:hypothetical protein